MSAAALVLQGPILSRGYDSNANIRRVINDFGALFETIVITTWKGSGLQREAWAHPHVIVVESDDVGTGVDMNGQAIGNRWRHLMGTGFGVAALQQSGFVGGYVIKQRSDQYLDLRSMLEHMRQNDARYDDYQTVDQKGFLYFLLLYRNNPYVVNDFVFAGHVDDVAHLIEASARYKQLIFRETPAFPEGDFLQKYIYAYLRPHYRFPEYRYFPRMQKYHAAHLVKKYPGQILDLWGEVLRTAVSAFPRKIAQSVSWRGQAWYPRAIEGNPFTIYSEEWDRYRLDIRASVTADLSAIFDLEAKKEDRAFFYLDERVLQAETGQRHSGKVWARTLYRQLIAHSHKVVFEGPEYVSPWRKRLAHFKSRWVEAR